MKTLLEIIRKGGGWRPSLYLKIENSPYMTLVIEAADESGPCGLPALSVAHYGNQNGDPMRAPEMCFELGFAGGAQLPAHVQVLAGRHRSTDGSAAEAHAARSNLDHDERVWQRADGSQARGERGRRQQAFEEGIALCETPPQNNPTHRRRRRSSYGGLFWVGVFAKWLRGPATSRIYSSSRSRDH